MRKRACDGGRRETVVFLHGIGVGPESWNQQLSGLPPGFEGIAPAIRGLNQTSVAGFSLDGAARDIGDLLDRKGIDRAHLCGLSLGALIATRFAIDHPDRCASLVLSGGQVHPNPILMRLQHSVLRVLPQRIMAPPGMTKPAMLKVLRDLAVTDFGPDLPKIRARTLVLCGARDRANLGAARQLANGIRGAQLRIVRGAGHQWNTRMPRRFNAELNAFLTGEGAR